MEVETLLHTKSKAEVAAAVRAACCSNTVTEHGGLLEQIVDRVLTTPKSLSDVDDDETLEWCQWLIAGGSSPEEFSQTVKHYDKATTCGLVWTENFVAYRCRTCGISPYLSLCTDCFHKGNHEGHDFIVFRSETGGACDCGDINLIRESGCCVLHGPRGTAAMQRAQMLSSELHPNLNNSNSSRGSNDPNSSSSSTSSSLSSTSPEQSAPPELFSIANGVMPRLFHRLIAYLRLVEARKLARAQQIHKNNMKPKKTPRPKTSPPQPVSLATAAAMMANTAVSPPPKGHKFIKLLQSFSDMGVAMRRVMTSTLTNTPVYKSLCGILNPEYERVGLQIPDHHQTFLEELVYWTVKREFPDDLKCLLLSLRTDSKYNEAFARAFITHYELISQSILKSSDPERLCKHIAAVSVQLFSNEKLAIAMVEQMQLLHLLLRILFDMIRSTAVPISPSSSSSSSSSPSSLLSPSLSGREEEISLESEVEANDISNNSCNSSAVLKVIDCDNDIIKNNYYWLIKSDLKELLSHGPVATKFFKDGQLLSTWFEFLTLLQGMNVNKFVKKGEPHIERESASYVGAFMAELVISATLMWTLVSHLKDCSTSDITRNFVRLCWKQLNEWYNYVKYPKGTISFHLPLHRYFSTFVRQGLQYQGMSLNDLLPTEEEFTPVVEQVLRLTFAYYGISTRLWARNGPSLVNQAEYYVSSLCCNSMIDADLFLLQVAAVKCPGVSENKFVEMVLREFGMTDVLSIRSLQEDSRPMMMMTTTQELEPEEQMTMLENCLILLATLSSVRTNIGICDEDLMALEMSVLLCKSDKLHSELMEMRTERCGSDGQLKNFETVLAEIADFQAPRNMQQGIFTPKPRVWEEIYDPLYTLLRSSNRAEYQCSRDRYQDYVNRSKKLEKTTSSKNLWPPFRIPTSKPSFIMDPGRILLSKVFMEVAFVILYHGVNTGILSELTLSLCVYMLELCTFVAERGEDLRGFMTAVKIANKQDGGGGCGDDDEMVSGGEEENSESIVSLMIQLYTKLSESRKSYSLKPENDSDDDSMPSIIVDSRIGDGPLFIAKVLDKLAEKSEECKAYILSQIQRFQGDQQQSSQQELTTEEREREERRRKAKERTLNWMNENAMKRPQIDAMDEDQDDSVTGESGGQDGGENLLQQFQDHQCCICFEKLESKPNNPFGLMTHLSPCSILGYQRLHTPEGNGPFLKSIHSETLDEFLKYYVDFSIIQHVPLDPGFGAQLESCGHFIHQACFTGYMNSVKKTPPPPVPSSSDSKPVISFTYKEYTCPVCRQLGNSFLPIILNNLQVKSGSCNNVYTFGDISKLLKKRNNCPLSKAEKTAVDSFIKDMDACAKNNFETDLLKMLKDFVDDSPLVSSFLLTSHLRLALERQLKLSEGVSNSSSSSGGASSSSSFPSKKLSYMLPLIAAIKHQYKSLPLGYAKKLAQNWEMVCGKRTSNGKREVPTLLRDVETTLFHFVLSVPLENGGVNVFNGVVQAVYNLRVVQVLAAICSQFSERERREISRIFPQSQFKLEQIMSLILRKLEGKPEATVDILNGADENGNHKNADIPETQFIENLVQSLLIPFLRTAAQLKLEIFRDQLQSFPETFTELVTYLQLGERKMNNVVALNDPKFCVDFLHWRNGENSDPVLEYEGVIGNWCSELIQSFGDRNGELPSVKNHWAAELLKSYLYIYDKPSLIRLPREYDTIFETYRKIKCGNCELVPSTPALCLVCGEVLCLNELCCFDLELKVSEVISHCQKKCGRGTGLFLSVLTSEILIVKEKEACIWGSIFLDSFCEEDLELRRGKPLFLCQERLDILQKNWIAQSFYKANLKWFQHRNFL